MSLPFTIQVFLTIGEVTYGAAVPSAEDPLIPAPIPIPADSDSVFATMDKLFEPLKDPQKSETWSVSKGQKLKDEEEGKIFVGHYQKRETHHLREDERKHLGMMGEAIGSPWERVSIWKQIGTGNGILTSYNRTDSPGQILWVIGRQGEVWWKKETSGYPPHKPEDGFPVLKYRLKLDYDYFSELHVVHNAIRELHTNPEFETKLTYRELAERVDDLQMQKDCSVVENTHLTQQLADLKVRMSEIGSPLWPPQATPPSRPLDHGDSPQVTMLKARNDELKMRESAAIQNWRNEKAVLIVEHEKVVEGMFDQKEFFKWSCIVSAVTLLVTAFVMCCGFKCYHSNQKNQWEIQRLQGLLDVNHDDPKNDEIAESDRNVAVKIDDYRPRSHSLDELHHKFGMNEIVNVTAKEGADLVRIARPLETAGEERKLSEELLGIKPIISDGTGGTKRSTTNPSTTGTKGEEGAEPI